MAKAGLLCGPVVLLLSLSIPLASTWADDDPPSSTPQAQTTTPQTTKANAEPKHRTETVRGRVVWFAEAMRRRHRAEIVPEAAQRILALETREGDLRLILEDRRGRAFRLDERLRDRDVVLRVRRYPGAPAIQILHVYAVKKQGLYELDYWCDICAIALYELGPCDCCQGGIRLRERKVRGSIPFPKGASSGEKSNPPAKQKAECR